MKKQKIVVLITGHAGTGKSYFANLINKSMPDISHITSFAKVLKKHLNTACEFLYGKEIAKLTSEEKEQFRPVLQSYGQVGRAIDKEFWVDKTKEVIDNSIEVFALIDDCRFENELHSFDDYEVIKIRLNRKSANKNVNQDISETALDHISDEEFDMVVNDEKDMSQKEVDKAFLRIFDLLVGTIVLKDRNGE